MHGDGWDCSDNDEDVTPFVCTDRIFLTKGQGKGPTGLFSVPHDDTDDLDDGVVLIGSKVSGVNYNGAGYDPVTDFIFGINPWDHMIWRVSMNGHATEMGQLAYAPGVAKLTGSIYAGDMNSDGVFVILATPARRLAYVDLSQSPPMVTKSIFVYYADSNNIAFGPDGMIYCFDGGRRRLAQIDPATGAARSLGHNQEPKGWGALGGQYFDKYGNFYGLDNKRGKLYKWKDVAGQDDITAYSNQHEIMITDIAPSSTNDGCSCQTGTEEILPGKNFKIQDTCEGEDVVMECEEGQVIKIRGAYYGRRDRNTCPVTDQMDSVQCDYQDAREAIVDLCDGEQTCVVPVNLDFFDGFSGHGDPCPGTHKYLSGHYQCREVHPCQNGQQDGDEEGVDCGGSCSQSCSSSKITICHKPGTAAEQTKKVSEAALDALLAIGGYLGECGTTAIVDITTEASWNDCNNGKFGCLIQIQHEVDSLLSGCSLIGYKQGNKKNNKDRSARADDYDLILELAVIESTEEDSNAMDEALTVDIIVASIEEELASDWDSESSITILVEATGEVEVTTLPVDCSVYTCTNMEDPDEAASDEPCTSITEPVDCTVMACVNYPVDSDDSAVVEDPDDAADPNDAVVESAADDSNDLIVFILVAVISVLGLGLIVMTVLYRRIAQTQGKKVFSKVSSNTSFADGPTIASFNDIVVQEPYSKPRRQQNNASQEMLPHEMGTSSGNSNRAGGMGLHWENDDL